MMPAEDEDNPEVVAAYDPEVGTKHPSVRPLNARAALCVVLVQRAPREGRRLQVRDVKATFLAWVRLQNNMVCRRTPRRC